MAATAMTSVFSSSQPAKPTSLEKRPRKNRSGVQLDRFRLKIAAEDLWSREFLQEDRDLISRLQTFYVEHYLPSPVADSISFSNDSPGPYVRPCKSPWSVVVDDPGCDGTEEQDIIVYSPRVPSLSIMDLPDEILGMIAFYYVHKNVPVTVFPSTGLEARQVTGLMQASRRLYHVAKPFHDRYFWQTNVFNFRFNWIRGKLDQSCRVWNPAGRFPLHRIKKIRIESNSDFKCHGRNAFEWGDLFSEVTDVDFASTILKEPEVLSLPNSSRHPNDIGRLKTIIKREQDARQVRSVGGVEKCPVKQFGAHKCLFHSMSTKRQRRHERKVEMIYHIGSTRRAADLFCCDVLKASNRGFLPKWKTIQSHGLGNPRLLQAMRRRLNQKCSQEEREDRKDLEDQEMAQTNPFRTPTEEEDNDGQF
ncbi:MAG: hypothetical protein M1814_005936 [Vezdaea aestivalis]|nr:MAG: hypothetical protein M1814_005936 [Vezdaea aestivalis]